MTLMSLTAYAATHRATRQAAKKWQDRGYLVMQGEQVDAEASDAKMEVAGKGRFRTKAHGGRRVEGERGLIDRPGLGIVGGVTARPAAPTLEPWRSDDPTIFGVVLRTKVLALAEEVQGSMGVDVDVSVLLDLADGAIQYEWFERCQTKGWYEWPQAIAATIAKDIGAPALASAIAASLQRHTVARLTALHLGPEDFTDPSLTAR
ncbi:hypothetical protein ACWGNZ_00840 [Sphingomonas zeae]